MPRLARVEVRTDYAPSGTLIAIVRDRVSTIVTRDVAGDESVQLVVPRNSPSNDNLVIRRVLRLVRRDRAGVETFDQWRIAERRRVSGLDASTYTYVAKSPLFDLVKGIVAQVLSTGQTLHVFTVNGLTPAQILTMYALPALATAGVTNFSVGTMDSSAPVTNFAIDYMSPLALCQALRDQTGLELRARQNGGSGFFIDLVTQIGAGAPRPTFRLKKNILSNQIVEQTTDQVTRCLPRGDHVPNQPEYHTIARVILNVTAAVAAGGSIALTVADPAGSIRPIGMDDEFNTWCVFRQLSGATFPITDTIENTQQIVITSKSSIGVDEYIELRSSDAQSQRVGVPRIAPSTGVAGLPYMSAGDPSIPTRFVVSDAGAGGIDFVLVDGQYTDLFCTFCTQLVSDAAVTVDGANGRFAFTSSIATAAVGDLIYSLSALGAASPPHGQAIDSILWEITSLDLTNKYAYVKPHYSNRASEVLPNVTPRRAVIMHPASTQQVYGSIAAGNKIDLTTNVVGGNVGKVVLIEQWCAGVLPAYLDDPIASQAPPAGYGIIPRPLDKTGARGEGNLIRNPLFAAWTTPTNPPDGWSHDTTAVTGGTPEHSQNTDPTYIKYGLGGSWNVTLLDIPRSIATAPTSPVFYINPVGFSDLVRTAYKLSFFLGGFTGDAQIQIVLKTTGPIGVPIRAPLTILYSTDTTASLDASKKFAPNQWVDITIPAVDILALFGDYARTSGGFQLQILGVQTFGFQTTNVAQIHLDATAGFQITHDPGSAAYVDGSFANRLLDAGNRQLQTKSQPSKEYTLKMLDVSLIPSSPWTADEITLGGQVDLRNPDLSVIETPRVTQAVIDEDHPENGQLTLETVQSRLTTILAGVS